MIHLMHSIKNIVLIHQTIDPYSLESNEVVDRKKSNSKKDDECNVYH